MEQGRVRKQDFVDRKGQQKSGERYRSVGKEGLLGKSYRQRDGDRSNSPEQDTGRGGDIFSNIMCTGPVLCQGRESCAGGPLKLRECKPVGVGGGVESHGVETMSWGNKIACAATATIDG